MYQQQQAATASSQNTAVHKIHIFVDRYVDYGEENIVWLIAMAAGQTVPERDQALHDKLVVRIHQETLGVKGSCLYYVHNRVSGRL